MSRNFARGSDQVGLGDITEFRFENANQWSIIWFWRAENTSADDNGFVAKWGANSNQRQFIVRQSGGTAPRPLQVFAGNALRITGGTNTGIDTWYCGAVAHDGTSGGMKLYNATLDGTVLDDGVTGSSWSDVADLTTGMVFGNQGGSPLDGDMACSVAILGEITKDEWLAFIHDPFGMAVYFKEKYGLSYLLPLEGSASPEPDWSGKGNSGTLTGTSKGDNPPVRWLGSRGPFLGLASAAAGNVKTLAAVATGVATLNRQISVSRALAATATGIAAMTLALQVSRVLSAVATGVASLTRLATWRRTLAATATGITTLLGERAGQFTRTLAATATGVATVTIGLSLSRTLNAVATGTATLTRQASVFRTLAATATGVAGMAAGRLFEVTLSAIATVVATVTAAFTEAPEEPTVPFSGHAGIGGRRSRWRLRRTKWKRRR